VELGEGVIEQPLLGGVDGMDYCLDHRSNGVMTCERQQRITLQAAVAMLHSSM